MAVPRQFVINGDSEVLGLCCFLQSMAMNIIGRLNDVAFICDPDVFTLVWIEQHLPVLFPFLKLVEVCLLPLSVLMTLYHSIQ